MSGDAAESAQLSPAARKVVPWAIKWGARFDVPISWVMAICEIESTYRPDVKNMAAVSQGGAWGLMQVTATTAATLVAKLRKDGSPTSLAGDGFKHFDHPEHACLFQKWRAANPDCLLDPELNVLLGTYYLSRFAAEFGRNFEQCAAAYHNGGGFLRGFLAAGKHFPSDLPPKAGLYVQRAVLAKLKFADEDKTPSVVRRPPVA